MPLFDHTFTVVQLAVGPEYVRSILANEYTVATIIRYCIRNRHGYVLHTKSLCQLQRVMKIDPAEIGPYFDICDPNSLRSRWYGKQGWKWAWTKPWTLLYTMGMLSASKWRKTHSAHYMYYIDMEAVIFQSKPDANQPSLKRLLAMNKQAAETYGFNPKQFEMHMPSGDHESPPHLGNTMSSDDQMMFDMSSVGARDFLRNWIRHSDCEAWADQGAYFIEILRWTEREATKSGVYVPNLTLAEHAARDENRDCNVNSNQLLPPTCMTEVSESGTLSWGGNGCGGQNCSLGKFQSDQPVNVDCRIHYDVEIKKGVFDWLENQVGCLKRAEDVNIVNIDPNSRRCTWTTPTSMACGAYDFSRCFQQALALFGVRLGAQSVPPVLYYNRTDSPFSTTLDRPPKNLLVPPDELTLKLKDILVAHWGQLVAHARAPNSLYG